MVDYHKYFLYVLLNSRENEQIMFTRLYIPTKSIILIKFNLQPRDLTARTLVSEFDFSWKHGHVFYFLLLRRYRL